MQWKSKTGKKKKKKELRATTGRRLEKRSYRPEMTATWMNVTTVIYVSSFYDNEMEKEISTFFFLNFSSKTVPIFYFILTFHNRRSFKIFSVKFIAGLRLVLKQKKKKFFFRLRLFCAKSVLFFLRALKVIVGKNFVLSKQEKKILTLVNWDS